MILSVITLLISFKCFVGEEVNIAGLFENDTDLEKALTYAIDFLNKNQNEEDVKFVALTQNEVAENEPFSALHHTCLLLEAGVVAVFGPRSFNNIDIVQSICDSKEIPHIITRWNLWPMRLGSEINFYPHPPLLAKAYLDIIFSFEWESFTVLYEDNESLMRVTSLIETAKSEGLVVQVMQLEEGNYRSTIKDLKNSGESYIVLDCEINHLIEILTQLQQAGIMNERFHYFITNLDAHTEDLSPFMYSNANITGIRIINPGNEYVQKVSEELYPDDYTAPWKLRMEPALIIDAMQMFAEIFNHRQNLSPVPIVENSNSLPCYESDSWEHGYSVVNMLKTSSYEGLTGLVRFNNEGFRSEFLIDIYELREGGITDIGNWNSTSGLNLTRFIESQEISDMESLRNKTFIVLITLTEPYGMLKQTTEPKTGNDRFEGYTIDLIDKLSELEGFNYTFVVREDKMNGAFNKTTKKWTGMIGDLLEHKADLAICDFTITSDRVAAVDFTVPFMNLGVSILFKKPKNAPPSFFSFADPFGIDTWIALAVSFFVTSLLLYLMGRLCADEWTNPYPCIEEPEHLINQFSFNNAVWFATGSLLAQGSEIAPIAISTRMAAGMWWYFCLIITASYTANLAAFLATENPVELFKDLQSLYENQHKIKYGAKENGATLRFFIDAEEGTTLHKIGQHMVEHPENVKENDEGVLRAEREDEHYAFFMESTSIEYATQRHCSLKQYGGLLDEKGYGIAMRKNSPYRKRLSLAILELQMSHFLDELKTKWWEERRGGGACGGVVESSDADPLGLRNVEGCFFVTIYGTIFAFGLVIFEQICYIIKASRKSRIPFKTVLMMELKSYLDFNSNEKPNVARSITENSKSQSQDLEDTQSEKKKTKSKSKSKSPSIRISKARSPFISKSKSGERRKSRSMSQKTSLAYGFVIPPTENGFHEDI
ncbi:glutamate receptor ionotropic, kainate 2 isoform X1 [Leptinotarsa decemlineata]|uniref:glutamate receptor ionotropic, kainate 2 isoform X1 n=1 Tax=Leptinotarsa decemlineata TaxID=7539 RepID=UPI003D303FBC